MAVTIKTVSDKADMKKFIRFNYKLYKDNPYSVPDLYDDMLRTFSPKQNAAFEFCQVEFFLAYKDEKLVGRVAAIINNRSNETWKKNAVRFGWIDFVDDEEVSEALLGAVSDYGKKKGMNIVEGPLGFTDMDAEGMLVEGFDQLSTMATIYNHPYYPKHLEHQGYKKAMDWVEFKIFIPKNIPEKHKRITDIVMRKYDLHICKIKNKKEIRESGLAYDIFRLINEAYKPLFGYSEMTEKQIDQYVKEYVPLLDLDMVTIIEDANNKIVGVAITMASLSKALQKSKGKLLPFGWFHLLKALKFKRPKVLDLLLIAVKPEYQSKGINALVFTDLIPVYQKMGFEYAETNPELEVNNKVQAQWQYFKTEQHKRRRCFTKEI